MTEGQLPHKVHYRIGEISRHTGLKPHVLRYWETEFPQIRPDKSQKGQRLYRRRDLELIMEIKRLLYEEKYTIAGAKLALKNYRAGKRVEEEEQKPNDALADVLDELHIIREILRR